MKTELKINKNQIIEEIIINKKDEIELLNQFYITVEASYERFNNFIKNNTEQEITNNEIKELLQKPKSWLNIYKVEHLLVDLYDDNYIQFEIKRRMLEIDRNLFKEQILFYNSEFKNLETLSDRRNFLSRLINDLQWRYTIRETKLEFQRKARKNSSSVLLLSILFFMTVLLLSLFNLDRNKAHIDKEKFSRFFVLIEVAAAGMFGASLSIATSINRNVDILSFDNLKLTHRFNYILSRVSIGIGAAIIMFYFIQSGILTVSATSITDDNEYKLIIWGFISGFSKKLIPSVINKASKDFESENANKTKKE